MIMENIFFDMFAGEIYKENLYDSDERLNHNSWTIGGTRITNFSLHRLEIYKAAVKEYGSENLVISNFAYDNIGNNLTGQLGSLHQINEKRDLSAFWKIFDRIKNEQKQNS